MKKIYLYAALCGILPLTTSCWRDDIPDCPPLVLNLAVLDKNYFNVDEVAYEQRLDEDLPFSSYVPTLYWRLQEKETGKTVAENSLSAVSGNAQLLSITLPTELPHGEYVFTAWGGMQSPDPLGDNPETVDFHIGNTEGDDIYMTHDLVTYDAYTYEHTLYMERTKGKLIVLKENLPEDGRYSTRTVGDLAATTNISFSYSGNTFVKSLNDLGATKQEITKSILSPSTGQFGSSYVDLSLFADASRVAETYKAPRVAATMKRNEITTLKYVWDEARQEFEVYLLLDNRWQQINNLDIWE